MRVVDPGHLFLLAQLDRPDEPHPSQMLQFVKRVGDKFPGNEGPAVAGVTSQEVIRALISRTKYVDNQIAHPDNWIVLNALRAALIRLEMRAAERRGDQRARMTILNLATPENVPVCPTCGHMLCQDHP